MSYSETITRTDLTNILNEVLPPTPSEYRKLLWTNPNPTANFSAQTVSIDLSDYDEVEVVTVVSRTSGKMGICHLYFTSPVSQSLAFLGDDATKHARDLSINTSGITFQNGYYQYMTSGQAKTTDSGQAIPYKIYGIKYERVNPPQEEIADYVVDQGTSGDWTYRKWNSGIVECWRLASISSMSWSAYITGLYYGNVSFNFPFAISNPLIYANIRRVSSNVGWVANTNYSNSTSFSLTIVRNGNSGDIIAQVYVKGEWK